MIKAQEINWLMSYAKENMSLTLVNASKYVLRGPNITVTYGEAGADGKPYLNYSNTEQSASLSFKGEEIRTIQNTDVGKVVSVSIRRTVDAGSTSFTLLLPRVLVTNPGIATIHTVGITTLHKFSILPQLMAGQIDLYTTVALTGTASTETHP